MYTRYSVHAVFYVRNGSDTPGFMNSQESSAPLTLLSLISHGSSTIQRVNLQSIAVIITVRVREYVRAC